MRIKRICFLGLLPKAFVLRRSVDLGDRQNGELVHRAA